MILLHDILSIHALFIMHVDPSYVSSSSYPCYWLSCFCYASYPHLMILLVLTVSHMLFRPVVVPSLRSSGYRYGACSSVSYAPYDYESYLYTAPS